VAVAVSAVAWDGFEVGAPVGPVKLVASSLPLAQASSGASSRAPRATGEARLWVVTWSPAQRG
jgi:hypothetical protein